jgi:hypothetical protein
MRAQDALNPGSRELEPNRDLVDQKRKREDFAVNLF